MNEHQNIRNDHWLAKLCEPFMRWLEPNAPVTRWAEMSNEEFVQHLAQRLQELLIALMFSIRGGMNTAEYQLCLQARYKLLQGDPFAASQLLIQAREMLRARGMTDSTIGNIHTALAETQLAVAKRVASTRPTSKAHWLEAARLNFSAAVHIYCDSLAPPLVVAEAYCKLADTSLQLGSESSLAQAIESLMLAARALEERQQSDENMTALDRYPIAASSIYRQLADLLRLAGNHSLASDIDFMLETHLASQQEYTATMVIYMRPG